MPNPQEKYKARRYYFTLGIITFGSLRYFASSSIQYKNSFDPVFQTFAMFFGEFLCFIFMLIGKNKKLAKISLEMFQINNTPIPAESNPQKMSWYYKYGRYCFIIPAIFDSINSIIEVICFNYLTIPMIVSLQMLKIIFIMYYRFNHVNRTIFKHQKLGLFIFICGIIIMLIEIITNDNYASEAQRFIGIILMLIAEFFAGGSLLVQEFLMMKLNTAPSEVCFVKGFYGIILCIILYFPLGFLFEAFFQESNYEKPFTIFTESYDQPLYFVILVILFCLFNLFLIITIKFTESLTASTIDSSRIIITWIIVISINIDLFDKIEVIGGCLIVLGSFIYNEFLVIPWCGFKESAQESMENNRFYIEEKNKSTHLPDAFFLDPSDTVVMLAERK